MGGYKTFTEYLAHRDKSPAPVVPELAEDGDARVSPTGVISDRLGFTGGGGQVAERSSLRNPFRGAFKAVNPARPASPTNSRLLASPTRRRLGSQVMGR